MSSCCFSAAAVWNQERGIAVFLHSDTCCKSPWKRANLAKQQPLQKRAVFAKRQKLVVPMASLLRGFRKDMQTGKAQSSRPCKKAKDQGSNLATALLSLWGHGHISASTLQWLAHSAMLDGAQHAELQSMASCGNYGLVKGNVHRDLVNKFCKNIEVPMPFSMLVPCWNPKTSKEDEDEAAIFLPHVMFAALAKGDPNFEDRMGTRKLSNFWEKVKHTGDDRLANHPCTLAKGWESSTVPIFLHGDGVEYHTRDSLMVWSWGSLLPSDYQSVESHFLMASYPKTCTAKGTWDAIMKWQVWSLQALAKGYHPTHDPDGKALQKASPFYLEKGMPLTEGRLKAVVWSIQGDHEFFANVLHLPHWRNAKPCWECDCTQADGPKPYTNLRVDTQNFEEVTSAEALKKAAPHPLFKLPGLSTRMVRGDALHILFTKGIYAHLLGSILHHICWHDAGVQAKAPWERLAIVFDGIQHQYKKLESRTRLTNLRLSMFTNPKKPHAQHPFLEAKGAECKHLAPALLKVCQQLLDKEDEAEEHMLTALEAMVELVKILDGADLFLSASESAQAEDLAKVFLDSYAWLSDWSLEKGKLLFHKVMKHHTFQHLIWNAKFLNPKGHWNFKGEDYVGRISTLAHSVSSGVRATRISVKLGPKYRLLLHLLLTRPGMQLVNRDLE